MHSSHATTRRNGWQAFSPETATIMEHAVSGGQSVAKYTHGAWSYTVDFDVMMQRNMRTGMMRRVRRTPPLLGLPEGVPGGHAGSDGSALTRESSAALMRQSSAQQRNAADSARRQKASVEAEMTSDGAELARLRARIAQLESAATAGGSTGGRHPM